MTLTAEQRRWPADMFQWRTQSPWYVSVYNRPFTERFIRALDRAPKASLDELCAMALAGGPWRVGPTLETLFGGRPPQYRKYPPSKYPKGYRYENRYNTDWPLPSDL